MTTKQYRKAYRELARKTHKMVLAYGESALKSGALNLEADDSLYLTPKNVLTAACRDVAEQWAPNSWNGREKRAVKNIQSCVSPASFALTE